MGVPPHFAERLGRRELKLSLRTSHPLTAKLRTRLLSNALEAMFGSLAAMPQMAMAAIHDRVRAYFQTTLNATLEQAANLPLDPKNDIADEIAYLRDSVERMRTELAAQAFSQAVQTDAALILESQPDISDAVGLEEVQYTRSGVLRAKIEQRRILAAQLSGRYDETLPRDPLFAGMAPTNFTPLPGEVPSGPPKPLTLKELAESFLAHKAKHDFAAKTTADVRRVLALAYEIIAPQKPVAEVTTDDIKLLRDLIGDLPPNYMKQAGNSGISAKAASETNKTGRSLSLPTQEKYLRMFKSVLSWAADEGHIAKVPGNKVKIAGANKLKAIENRYPYSSDQLKEIVSSPLYKGHSSPIIRHRPGKQLIRDGKLWTPLIARYSGMRMGGIVQLLSGDIRQDGTFWYFDVSKTEGGGKKIKTLSSVRRIPLHHTLIDIGFLNFHASTLGKGRLFPDIECGSDGYCSHNFSKWWGRCSRQVKFFSRESRIPFLSAQFQGCFEQSKGPESIAKALMGHADNSVHAQYASGPSLAMLKEHIDRITYPIDLGFLKS